MNTLELNIYPDSKMIPIAILPIKEYAKMYFDDEKDISNIGLAIEESIATVTEFLTGQRNYPITITANAKGGKFIITVTDKELPGDFEKVLTKEENIGQSILNLVMDETKTENLGMGGRRQTLVKNYSVEKPDFLKDSNENSEIEPEGDKHTYTIRLAEHKDMIEIVRILYNEYGNSYDVEGSYDPEHHWEQVVNDEAIYLVAETEEKDIASITKLSRVSFLPGIWDLSMLMTKPKYRKGNLIKILIEGMLKYAKDRKDITGVFSEATTVHPYTQKAFNNFGLKSVGFTLGMMPRNIYQPVIAKHEGRGSFAEAMIIYDDKAKEIYIREEQKDFVKYIADSLGIKRIIKTSAPIAKNKKTVVVEDYVKVLDTGYVYINEIGEDIIEELHNIDYSIKKKGGLTNEIYLNAEDTGAIAAGSELVKMGYFCERYLPCKDGNDWIVYGNLFTDPIDYDTIKTEPPFDKVLEMVKSFDPDLNIKKK